MGVKLGQSVDLQKSCGKKFETYGPILLCEVL